MNNPQTIPYEPAWLYHGKVMHTRIAPQYHRFHYRVFSLLIDIDKLLETDKLSPLFSIGRFNLVSFYPSDHLPPDSNMPLREYVEQLLQNQQINWQPGRILLGCYPRILGQVFNPLSVFYIYKNNGHIGAIIYEVRNTFGEKHYYICPVHKENITPTRHIKQQTYKNFYVSPFMQMNMQYLFIMLEPYDKISWRIIEKQAQQPMLAATYLGYKKNLTTIQLVRFCLQIPFLTWKILGGIHFEALRLWLKGLAFIPRNH